MFTKPKNAYSLTHTIIWDILYCYSASIQIQFDWPQIHRIIGELLPFCPRPSFCAVIPSPLQRHHMINVDLTAILNDLPSERTDPAASDDPAAILACKTNLGGRLSNQRLCTAVLAVTISIIPAVSKSRTFVFT